MLQQRALEALLDIERASQKICQFKQGIAREILRVDEKTQSAIVFQLLIVGEATKRLSMNARQQYPEVPWTLMAGMRDKLIHNYDDIDAEEV